MQSFRDQGPFHLVGPTQSSMFSFCIWPAAEGREITQMDVKKLLLPPQKVVNIPSAQVFQPELFHLIAGRLRNVASLPRKIRETIYQSIAGYEGRGLEFKSNYFQVQKTRRLMGPLIHIRKFREEDRRIISLAL